MNFKLWSRLYLALLLDLKRNKRVAEKGAASLSGFASLAETRRFRVLTQGQG